MIKKYRRAYNESFSEERYEQMLNFIFQQAGEVPSFNVAETPVFIPSALHAQLLEACNSLTQFICRPDFKKISQGALLPENFVPGETAHPAFVVMDFGVCRDEHGRISPQLVEIQGFPSLFFYQELLARAYQQNFEVPADLIHLFGGLDRQAFVGKLRNTIIGDCKPENVVLVDIHPKTQNTRVDFWITSRELGIKVLDITDIKVEGRSVFYFDDSGKRIPIDRIYNRVIFDELYQKRDLPREFYFRKEYDMRWVGHPHWFFRISKHTLPFLESPYVPKTWFLNEWAGSAEELRQYVLKPLYSFSGQGIILHPTMEDIRAIPEEKRSHYILQKRVEYAPVIQTPDVPAKLEIRMMHIWDEGATRPELLTSLVRLSKGAMVGVRYNKDKRWVGSSVGFFEKL